MKTLSTALEGTPIIASLRGLELQSAAAVSAVLVAEEIHVLEVIVRSRSSFEGEFPRHSIDIVQAIQKEIGESAIIAAGSVAKAEDVKLLMDLGVNVFLSPFYKPEVVEFAASHGKIFIPGIETVTEAFDAWSKGAKGVKLFPSIYKEETGAYFMRHSPGFVKYLAAFLPIPIIPSGDFGLDSPIEAYFKSGALAVNIGKQLFSPDVDLKLLQSRSAAYVKACRAARN